MTRTKAKTPKTKAPKQGETRTFKVKYVVNLDPVVMLAPPDALERCPRCDKPHPKLKPKKLIRPMMFSNCSASYWVACPTTKEPVIFFDRFTKVPIENSVEQELIDQSAKEIAKEVDKDVLSSLSTWTASYTLPKKGKGKKSEPMHIEASFGPATTWAYDPDAKQAADVLAQEAQASLSLASGPAKKTKKR